MPGPIGNKHALGNQGGRPPEYDRVAVAKDLLNWAKQDDSININKFCALNDIPSRTFLNWVDEDDEFRRAYDKCKTFLAFRREEKLNNSELHVKAFDLNATVYDQFTRKEKIAMDDMESARKVKEIAAGTAEDRQKKDDVINMLDRLQKDNQSSSSLTNP